jgi:hypothetical protein
VQRQDAKIGFTTVYRTLKLLAECGLASEVAFHDGIARYEHQYNRRSHHHMVCTECGSSVEFFSPEVDGLEQEIGANTTTPPPGILSRSTEFARTAAKRVRRGDWFESALKDDVSAGRSRC